MIRQALALTAAAVLATSAAQTTRADTFINVLTGGTSGVYYPLGVALSDIYADAVPDARPSVQSTKASVENLNLLQAGRGEVAFTLGDTLSLAAEGDEEAGFREPLNKLRGMAGLYDNYIQIVASAESGIESIEDLKGKRVSVGAPKSGTELNARAVFESAGISYDDLGKVEYLPFAESVELIKNRQLDATLQSAGLGVASIRDLAASVPIKVVAIPEDVVTGIGDPAYQPGTIPAGTYSGQEQDVPAARVTNFLVTHDEVDEELVYQMTKSMFDNLDRLQSAHAAAKDISLEDAVQDMPVPLHPGAERFYREAGVVQQ